METKLVINVVSEKSANEHSLSRDLREWKKFLHVLPFNNTVCFILGVFLNKEEDIDGSEDNNDCLGMLLKE